MIDGVQRILLTTNLAPHSDRAMERAVQLVHQFGADLAVVYARQGDERANPIDRLTPAEIEAELRRHLAAIPGGSETSPVIAVMTEALDEAVKSYAELWKPDLMVCGAHASDTLTDLFKITTVERLSVASEAPLLVVRNKPFGQYLSALVPVDFSEMSRPALEAALALIPEGSIRLLHVFDVPAAAAVVHAPTRKMEASDFADDFASLLAGLDTSRRAIGFQVAEGMPKHEIVGAAMSDAPDIIVMGTTGRTGLGRVLMGSTAHEVLQRLPTDVLLVRE